MNKIDRTRLGTFFGLLIGFAIVFEAISVAMGVSFVQLTPVYMFTPLVAGAVTVWRSDIGFSAVGLRLGRFRWLVAAALLPLPLVYATLGISLLVPGISFNPGIDLVPGLSLPSGIPGMLAALGLVLILGVTVNALLAVGEEVGWRGYLLWELAPLGFWKASILIGTAWGIWHAPAIVEGYNYPSFPLIGFLVMTLATITFSFLYTYLVLRARSVLAAIFYHGVFNASGGLVIAYTTAENAALTDLVASPVGVASMIVFLLVAAGIYLAGTPNLDRAALSGTE